MVEIAPAMKESGVLAGLASEDTVAAELGVCKRTLKNYEDRRLLVPIKIGRKKYYDIEQSRRRLRGEPEPIRRRRRRQQPEEASA